MSKKTHVDSAAGTNLQWDLMQKQEEFCAELIRYIPEPARKKFRDLKILRPSNLWTETHLEDLKTLAVSAYMVEFYQMKELEFGTKGYVMEAEKSHKLMKSNVDVVDHYTKLLQLKPSQTISIDPRDAIPALEVEKQLREIKEGSSGNVVSLYN